MKKLVKITFESIKAVSAYKLRTFFCILSVALGISSICVIVAAVEGTFKKAYEMVDKFGPDAILIIGGGEEARAFEYRAKTITVEDVEAYRQSFPGAYSVMPMTFDMNAQVSYKGKKYLVRLIGATAEFTSSWAWYVEEGFDFTEADIDENRNVCLLGSNVAKELFSGEYAGGKYILIKQIPMLVLGILSSRGTSPAGENLDDRVIIPISTMMKKIQNESKYVNVVRAKFYDQSKLRSYEKETLAFFRQRHNISQDEPDDISVISSKLIMTFLAALTGSLVVFLGTTGIISLIVAGFVLANLFLLSVNERTKEIGIRRALGARKWDIMFQFVGESVIVTSVGGIFGYIISVFASKLLTLVADFPIYFSFNTFLIGLVLSWVVGVFSGLQPAKRAADINPIEAIRK